MRIGGRRREILWGIFERVRAGLAEKKAVTWADVFGRLTDDLAAGNKPPFDFAVVDEAQDHGVAEAWFLGALSGNKPDGLFFTGDLGATHFPAAVLVEGPRARCARTFFCPADQLPDFASDADACGPTASGHPLGRGRQC
jgi:hypothetical protein